MFSLDCYFCSSCRRFLRPSDLISFLCGSCSSPPYIWSIPVANNMSNPPLVNTSELSLSESVNTPN